MPETREWPAPLRRLAKLSLAIIYAGASVAGWHVVFALEHAGSPWWTVGLGLIAGAGGVLALVFMLLELWMAERPAAWIVAFALSVYALVDGARVIADLLHPPEVPDGPDVGGTALLWAAAAAVGLRIVHLWAFDLNLHRAKARAEAARRRQARDAEDVA